MSIPINPHTVAIHPHVRVKGGKKTFTVVKDATISGNGASVVKETTIQVDNVKERKRADDFAARARNVARSFATLTPIGYLTDRVHLPEIMARTEELKTDAKALNSELETCQVHFDLITLDIAVTMSPEVVQKIFDDIRNELILLKTHVSAGDKENGKNVYNRVRHIAALTTGIQAESISYALVEARDSLKLGEPLPQCPALDNAITLLEPVDPATLPEAM